MKNATRISTNEITQQSAPFWSQMDGVGSNTGSLMPAPSYWRFPADFEFQQDSDLLEIQLLVLRLNLRSSNCSRRRLSHWMTVEQKLILKSISYCFLCRELNKSFRFVDAVRVNWIYLIDYLLSSEQCQMLAQMQMPNDRLLRDHSPLVYLMQMAMAMMPYQKNSESYSFLHVSHILQK